MPRVFFRVKDMHLFVSRRIILLFVIMGLVAIYAAMNKHLLWALPVAMLVVLMMLFFRSPMRRVPPEPLGIVAPVDAQVLAIDPITEGDLQGGWQIQLGARLTGPYVVRSPMEGKICDLIWKDTSSDGATRMVIVSDEKDRVDLLSAPRFTFLHGHCSVHPGERVGQGGVCGFVPFGGRFAVFLPQSSRILVQPGDDVRAGSDLLAKLVRS